MTTDVVARPRVPQPARAAVRRLALMEGRRMLRHPAPWLGLVLSVWWAYDSFTGPQWASLRYEVLLASLTPLLLGISLASASAFGRGRVAVADEAPVEPARRAVARLAGGLGLVALLAAVVAGAVVWLRIRGGLDLGDEPGRTLHAHYSLPELLQPVLLGVFAVAIGAAVVHVVRQRLVAAVVLFVGWFVVGATYWMLNSAELRWLTPLQVQPLMVDVGPPNTDPTTFPADWLLSTPGEFQHHWARLVVSPAVAAWHDAYLVGLTAMVVAVAVPGRVRRMLLVVGAALAVVAVLMQRTVAP